MTSILRDFQQPKSRSVHFSSNQPTPLPQFPIDPAHSPLTLTWPTFFSQIKTQPSRAFSRITAATSQCLHDCSKTQQKQQPNGPYSSPVHTKIHGNFMPCTRCNAILQFYCLLVPNPVSSYSKALEKHVK